MKTTQPPTTITHIQLVQSLHLVFQDRVRTADAASVQAMTDFVRDLARTLKMTDHECAAVLGRNASAPAASPSQAEQPMLFQLPGNTF